MKEWYVELAGDPFDLDELTWIFQSPELTVVKQEDWFYLRSTVLDGLEDINEVYARARLFLPLLSGAATLQTGTRVLLELGAVMYTDERGQRIRSAWATESAGMRVRVSTRAIIITDANGNPAPRQPPPAESWVKLAFQRPTVERALRFMSYHHDWINLYRVLDAIEEDVGGEKALEKLLKVTQWVNATELKRFTRTANSYQAIGDLARHGRADWVPPPQPMELGEAKQLITTLLKSWLDYRQKNP